MKNIRKLSVKKELPWLQEIPNPPKELFIRGTLERTIGTTFITIVGSRKYTPYGKHICEQLIEKLAPYPVTIVSGLALGIDTIAHTAALAAGLPTIAFPGSGLDWQVLYPRQHEAIARRIVSEGGALLSEFLPTTRAAPWMFPQRNRLEAGISSITIVIEAEKKSGTLITARLATEYNKTVCAVPGNITNPTAEGANYLIQLGAIPLTCPDDIIRELGFALPKPSGLPPLTKDEQIVFTTLSSPKEYDTLLIHTSFDPATLSIILSSLEIKGYVRQTLGLFERTF